MIYLLTATLLAVTWFATRRVSDPLRRAGVAIAAIGFALALAMWWMAFPFLIVGVIGCLIVLVSKLRQPDA